MLCKNTDRCSFLSFIWPASPIRPSVDASALHFIILACFLVTTLGDLQLQSSASGWKYGFSISLWFCHKFSSRKSERAMGRRAVHPPPPQMCFHLFYKTENRQEMRSGVRGGEGHLKRGGEVERIDSVCWTQIKVCLDAAPRLSAS